MVDPGIRRANRFSCCPMKCSPAIPSVKKIASTKCIIPIAMMRYGTGAVPPPECISSSAVDLPISLLGRCVDQGMASIAG